MLSKVTPSTLYIIPHLSHVASDNLHYGTGKQIIIHHKKSTDSQESTQLHTTRQRWEATYRSLSILSLLLEHNRHRTCVTLLYPWVYWSYNSHFSAMYSLPHKTFEGVHKKEASGHQLQLACWNPQTHQHTHVRSIVFGSLIAVFVFVCASALACRWDAYVGCASMRLHMCMRVCGWGVYCSLKAAVGAGRLINRR